MRDPERWSETQVKFVQPYQAMKEYICPNCDRVILAGTGHYVVVPVETPDLRRHWHRGCWNGRTRRGPRDY